MVVVKNEQKYFSSAEKVPSWRDRKSKEEVIKHCDRDMYQGLEKRWSQMCFGITVAAAASALWQFNILFIQPLRYMKMCPT